MSQCVILVVSFDSVAHLGVGVIKLDIKVHHIKVIVKEMEGVLIKLDNHFSGGVVQSSINVLNFSNLFLVKLSDLLNSIIKLDDFFSGWSVNAILADHL